MRAFFRIIIALRDLQVLSEMRAHRLLTTQPRLRGHDFSGDCLRDVSLNGQLRCADTDMLLNICFITAEKMRSSEG